MKMITVKLLSSTPAQIKDKISYIKKKITKLKNDIKKGITVVGNRERDRKQIKKYENQIKKLQEKL